MPAGGGEEVRVLEAINALLDYIRIAKDEGAVCALGGGPATRPECGSGWFVEPTIFTGVNQKMRIANEEIFAPVLSLRKNAECAGPFIPSLSGAATTADASLRFPC